MKSSRRATDPAALELVEEAVHLLRRTPTATWAIYYAGSVAFVLGLLFFWAHTTWFEPAGETVAWGALLLVALFAAMKVAHVEFCARLMAQRLGGQPPPWSWARAGRRAVAQMRLQPFALVALAFGAVLAIPFGWIYAYAQNAAVLGDEEQLHDEAVAQAKLWPQQNHVGLLMLALVALLAWGNLAVAFGAVPWLANHLLGIENIFGFSGWWFANTTFLASVTALTWLAIDPVVKAFYVLRVFHGRARRTGEDVRVELALARRAAPRAGLAAAVLVLALAPLPRAARAADAPPPATRPTTAVAPAQLDRAIDETLAGADFRWRLKPVEGKGAKDTDGPLKRFVRQGVEMLRDGLKAVGRWARAARDWWDRHFGRSRGEPEPSATARAGAASLSLVRLLLYGFIAAAVVLILWLVYLVWRQARQTAPAVLAAQAVAEAAPDLRDENIQAAQLPWDGWLALARQQAAAGEWRLALRALYLATLARLAAEELISLAKFKTNLDYERELRRRALSRVEIVARFVTRRRSFEDVWYGRAAAGEAEVRAWLAELERPSSTP